MAWQIPKTDWSAADGVRDSDFNRIESNILELYNASKVHDTVTIYVAPSGNDTLGTGGAASPFATIARALRDLPNDLNGIGVTINVAFGTYNEEVLISNFYNGVIMLVLNSSATVKALTVSNARVVVSGTTLTITNASTGLMVVGRGFLRSEARIEISGGANGIYIDENSVLLTSAAVTMYDTTAQAITITGCSFAFIQIVAGSGHNAGARVTKGSVLAYGSFNLVVNLNAPVMVTEDGGRIYTGSQGTNALATAEVI